MPNVEAAILDLVKKKALRLISRKEGSYQYAIDTRGLSERLGQGMMIIRYELLIRDQPDEGECQYEIIDVNEYRTGNTVLCTDTFDDVVHWIGDHSPPDRPRDSG